MGYDTSFTGVATVEVGDNFTLPPDTTARCSLIVIVDSKKPG